jgi:hypothetical protein
MAEEEGRGEGFLSRWSRLKQARREAAEAEPPPATPAAAPQPEPRREPEPAPHPDREPEPAPGADPEIDLATLPRIEDLTATSDLAVFLRKGVPAVLRNAALRRVWSLDPGIRDFIGPADYAWDWNVPGGAPGYAETIAHGPDIEALADRILGIGRPPPQPAGPEHGAEHVPAAQADLAAPEVEPAPPQETPGQAPGQVPGHAPGQVQPMAGVTPRDPAGEDAAGEGAAEGPPPQAVGRPRQPVRDEVARLQQRHGGAVPV